VATKVVSLNPTHDEVYLIQHYEIKLSVTGDMSVVFSRSSCFLTNKTDRHLITEILLKVGFNTITITLTLIDIFNIPESSIVLTLYLTLTCF